MDNDFLRFVANVLEISVDAINYDTRFTEDLALDSLTFSNLLSEIEDNYMVEFEDGRISKMLTIGDVYAEIKGTD